MIRALIEWRLGTVERELGQSLDYARHILRASLRSFLVFAKLLSIASYRRALPLDACHVARLVATRDADCGTCLLIEIRLAQRERVPAEVVRAVLDGRWEALPPHLAEVARFTRAVVRASDDADGLRGPVRERLGERALVELALAIASCRTFPIVKRTLGYATSCSRVDLSSA